MNNIRILNDNALLRTVPTASAASGTYTIDNATKYRKSSSYRSTGTSASIMASWVTPEMISCVAARCNLSSTSTWRVRATTEQQATNLVPGSESFASAAGWSGCALSATSVFYRGTVPYQKIAKAVTAANESRGVNLVGAVAVNTTIVLTIALRADTVSTCNIGLYDNTAASWGLAANGSAVIIEGPGAVVSNGGLATVSGLSTTQDTLLKITRLYVTSCTASVLIYPGATSDTTVGHSILSTRVQGEVNVASSYYPTGNTSATRPVGYIDSWQSYNMDTGSKPASPAPDITLVGWTKAQSANAYAYGGGTYATAWFAPISAYGIRIDITDTGNAQGFVDICQLIVANYWSSTYNFSSVVVSTIDNTVFYRTDAGDQITDMGTIHRKMQFSLDAMPEVDRSYISNALRNSKSQPVFISVYPESGNAAQERDYSILGRRVQDTEMSLQYGYYYSMKGEVEEM